MPLVENYAALLKKTGNTWQAINFHNALNNLQKNKKRQLRVNFLLKDFIKPFGF